MGEAGSRSSPATLWEASRALLAVTAPAVRLAALGPHRQPTAASSNDPGATWLELVARPLWGLAAHAAGGGTRFASA
jgi:hypothetical protein